MFTGETENLTIPKSDVLIYYTEEGSKIAARPSGTEPKIKFYVSVNGDLLTKEQAPEVESYLDLKIQNIIQDLGIK